MGKDKKVPKYQLPNTVTNTKKETEELKKRNLTAVEEKIHGYDLKREQQLASVSLKYYDPDYECFSAWSKEDLSAFSNFTQNVAQRNWLQIMDTGGKSGTKVGLGYTLHKSHKVLPSSKSLDQISPDIDFFELRVSEKARVHGFRCYSTFFLVWLDCNHQIYPQ